jgi:hypothetical protein
MWKFANMNNVARMALAATAAIVAVFGFALLSPSSSRSASAQPGCSPPATGIDVSSAPGTKLAVTEQGARFSFRVSTRHWGRFCSLTTEKSPGGPISLNKSIVGSQGAEALIYWTSFPNGDYADPCTRLLGRSVGSSAAVLAAAVSTAPGTEIVEKPSSVTLGGRPAKHLVLTVRKSTGCNPGFFYGWKAVNGGALWTTTAVGDTIRVWIVDVGGTRLFIAAATSVQANARLKREVNQIVESIRFA